MIPVFYLILVLLSGASVFLLPKSLSLVVTLMRESFFVILLVQGLVPFLVRPTLRFRSLDLHVGFYILSLFFFALFSRTISIGVSALIIYSSGPLLFLAMRNSGLGIGKASSILRNFILVLTGYLLLNILLFPFQPALLLVADIPTSTVMNHLFRLGADGTLSPRLFGLSFMPTVLAWLAVIIFFYPGPFLRLFRWVSGGFTEFLTGTRLFFPGIFLYLYILLRHIELKIVTFLVIITIGVAGLVLLFNDPLDPSLVIHIGDLLFEGPTLVTEAPLGRGLGNIQAFDSSSPVAVESDLFLLASQTGIIGGVLYASLLVHLYLQSRRLTRSRQRLARFGLALAVVFAIGSLFLPLSLHRPISNSFWMILGIIYHIGDRLEGGRIQQA